MSNISIESDQKWKELKWGMFSASLEFNLLSPGKYDKTTGTTPIFGDGAISYIRRVARQAFTLYNTEDEMETYAMKQGKAKESESFSELCRQLGRNDVLTYYGGLNALFVPYAPYKDDSGTSPDSVAWLDESARIASFGAELKNPSGDVHANYIEYVRDQQDLKKYSLMYFTQVQKAMMTFNCDTWLWCSHNEYFPSKQRLHIVEVVADKNFQNELEARIGMAVQKKHELIEIWKSR
jgi:hypothetical protein